MLIAVYVCVCVCECSWLTGFLIGNQPADSIWQCLLSLCAKTFFGQGTKHTV